MRPQIYMWNICMISKKTSLRFRTDDFPSMYIASLTGTGCILETSLYTTNSSKSEVHLYTNIDKNILLEEHLFLQATNSINILSGYRRKDLLSHHQTSQV